MAGDLTPKTSRAALTVMVHDLWIDPSKNLETSRVIQKACRFVSLLRIKRWSISMSNALTGNDPGNKQPKA